MTSVVVEGTVERLVYASAETGYSVVRLCDRQGAPVTVVGVLPGVNAGQTLRVAGRWVQHPAYGPQLVAERYEVVRPASVAGLQKYLGSGLVRGVGPVLAQRIVERFGAETPQIIEQTPERLTEVPGIGPQRAAAIVRAWREHQAIQDLMLFLQAHDLSPSLAVRIFQQYGDASLEVVRHDPYRLAREVRGIGFLTADRIARRLGFPAQSLERVMAGLRHLLWEAAEEGHVFMPLEDLGARARTLLGCTPEMVAEALARLTREENGLVCESHDGTTAVYLVPLFQAERRLAERLRTLLTAPADRLALFQRVDFERAFAWLAERHGLILTAEQRLAVRRALTSKVSVITGGPGTGKTTTIQALLTLLRAKRCSALLAAPTGRAARRLTEVTGVPARTIHRLLALRPGGEALYDAQNPLLADCIVVDEASMLDVLLANALVKAVPPDAHLVLVGDVDQLPAVGPGNVLRELIASAVVPVTRLTTVMRQAAGSGIVQNAHRINAGERPRLRGYDDFLFLAEDDPERAADRIVDLVVEQLPRRYGLDPIQDIQVLAPMHQGPLGVARLNERLQAALNPPAEGKPERRFGARLFRQGDKVLQVVNNYDRQVFNGEMGRITRLDLAAERAIVRFDDGRVVVYPFADLDELVLAYAVSVHKSQGCEYPAVVMPLTTQHYLLLQRNLLYTAVTRAQRLVVLVGSWRALAIAVRRERVTRRHTRLAWRLRTSLAGTPPVARQA